MEEKERVQQIMSALQGLTISEAKDILYSVKRKLEESKVTSE